MKWESPGAAAYYYLGASYYFYKWFIIAGIGTDLLSAIFLRDTLVLLIIALFVGTILVLAGIAAWLGRTRKRLHTLNPDVAMTKLIDTYQVLGSDRYAFEKAVTIRALHSGVDAYRTKFKWTGTGRNTMSVNPPTEGTAIQEPSREGVWDVVKVQLREPLTRKQEKSLTLKCDLEDTARSARPFFQKLIDDLYPNGLTMRVLLPATPKRVTREIFLSPRSELHIWFEEGPPHSHSREITWPIKTPVIGRRYKISWQM